MSRRSPQEAVDAINAAMAALGYTDDDFEKWDAAYGLTGVMIRDPACKRSRDAHSRARDGGTCNCLGPVTGHGLPHALTLLASMCSEPPHGPLPRKVLLGWTHVTTFHRARASDTAAA